MQPDGSTSDIDVGRSGNSLAVSEKGALVGTLRPESATRFFDTITGQTIDFVVEATGARMIYPGDLTGTRR